MDFNWSEAENKLRNDAKKFAAEELNSNLYERDKANKFSFDLWKKCAEFGLHGMPVSQRYGGSGADIFSIIAALEGLGYGCRDNGLLLSIGAHMWGCEMPIFHFGTEEQKKKYLPKLCSGEWIGALGMTEPESGSDISHIKTEYSFSGDSCLLNGVKTYITNAPIADVFIIYAKASDAKDSKNISCFLIEKETKGLSTGEISDKLGLRTCPMSKVILNDCEIPKANLIGKEGAGKLVFLDSMEWERSFIVAGFVGTMERQLEACIKFAKERKQFERPIGKFQSVANMIVDMKMGLETSRLMLYKTAWLKSRKRSTTLETAMSKLSITEAFIRNSRHAIQIHGGYGYLTENEIDRDLRDALGSAIFSGTSEIQRSIIANLIGL